MQGSSLFQRCSADPIVKQAAHEHPGMLLLLIEDLNEDPHKETIHIHFMVYFKICIDALDLRIISFVNKSSKRFI